MPHVLHADVIESKNTLVGADAWVWLLALEASGSTAVRLCTGNANVSYGGDTYISFPFSVGEFELNDRGELPECTITFGDPTGTLAGLVDANPEVDFSTCQLHRYVNGQVATTYPFTVERITATREGLAMTLGNLDPIANSMFPSQRVYRSTCRHQFLGPYCQYAGAVTTCDLTLRGPNGCIAKANQEHFGGVPGAM